jgi:hypothetical protein
MSKAGEFGKTGLKAGAVVGAVLGGLGGIVGGPLGIIAGAAMGAIGWGLTGGLIGAVVGAFVKDDKEKAEESPRVIVMPQQGYDMGPEQASTRYQDMVAQSRQGQRYR